MQNIILYGTLGCHLCEEAQALVAPLLESLRAKLQIIDISTSDLLVEQYGLRIPVLKRDADSAELDWPFSGQEAWSFLGKHRSA